MLKYIQLVTISSLFLRLLNLMNIIKTNLVLYCNTMNNSIEAINF